MEVPPTIPKGSEGALSCYNPMLSEPTPFVNPETGKRQYKFLMSVKKWLDLAPETEDELRETGKISVRTHAANHGVYRVNLFDRSTGELIAREWHHDLLVLPCGQCLDCRCRHAQEWANRIMLEAQYHDKSYFITLTYDDMHVPRIRAPDGEEVLTLRPKDLQEFIKRLRWSQHYYHENKIRYYAVGEYGSTTHRPHYHIIVFGLVLDDLKEIGRNKSGTLLHDSQTIRDLWQNGLTEVDEMTWEAAAYCARYTTKKLGKSETDFYKQHGLVPELSRMSLKPAIGWQYFDDHKQEIYDTDKIYIATAKGGRTVKPPRYFDQKFDDIYPAQMEQVKGNRREIAEAATVARLANYNGSYTELLYLNEQKMKNRNKMLRRNLEL